MMLPIRLLSSVSAALALSACSGLMPPTQVPMVVAPAWQAPLPHQGSVGSLAQWWQRQGDPLLVELIVAAQGVSPSVAQALASIENARANQAAARSALMPNLSAQASASRGVSQVDVPLATSVQGGLQASWELDLVGANRAASQAAQAQVEGSQALWHDARVAVAAEVAGLYHRLWTCQDQLALARRDQASRQQTAQLSGVSATAGLTAPATAALARASAADASSRVAQQAAQCQVLTKGLVALTAVPEPDLKQKLALAQTNKAPVAIFSIASVPAQSVAQRPDVFAAERDVVLASAQVGSAQAQRWPRLTLNGSIGALSVSTGTTRSDVSTWSFGPLALSLPLFDGGQRAAQVDAAQARYQAAVVAYQGKVRNAVREVEEALVQLHSAHGRDADAQVSTQGYAESLAATQKRFDQGLVSLVELEEARRSALAAESAELALQLEQRLAWVSLYRVLGGGFEPDQVVTPASSLAASAP
ncbi:efflux transporter outer membrane subunit [Rhodoferax sp.]|uniref:efflux transporter outer membrane subunit n=1 Tax=Rhodoferax sp. TaxID=50421 RepID=UPI00262A65D6|nr:efflux transporter outer membrane subunit [Rhodoferax sp.]MDD2925220.1 efflux transporter outer membrane subunit [Rhodoferax sp.]